MGANECVCVCKHSNMNEHQLRQSLSPLSSWIAKKLPLLPYSSRKVWVYEREKRALLFGCRVLAVNTRWIHTSGECGRWWDGHYLTRKNDRTRNVVLSQYFLRSATVAIWKTCRWENGVGSGTGYEHVFRILTSICRVLWVWEFANLLFAFISTQDAGTYTRRFRINIWAAKQPTLAMSMGSSKYWQ